jgi:hypothetical protein
MSEQGISFINNNDTAIISSEGLGYEWHSTQTYANRFSYTALLTGVWETYRVNTGDNTNPPLVFVADLGLSLEPGGAATLADTAKMIIVTSVKTAGTGIWDIVLRRGQDKLSSASFPLTLLFFKKLPSYNPVGYGVVVYDPTGTQPVYDSTRKMLMPRVFGSFGGSYITHSINFKNIANYTTTLTALSITRPAFMISGGIQGYQRQYLTKFDGVDYYCYRYHSMLYGLYSGGVASFYGWVGHNSDEGATSSVADACGPNFTSDTLGIISAAQQVTYMIIDADKY